MWTSSAESMPLNADTLMLFIIISVAAILFIINLYYSFCFHVPKPKRSQKPREVGQMENSPQTITENISIVRLARFKCDIWRGCP